MRSDKGEFYEAIEFKDKIVLANVTSEIDQLKKDALELAVNVYADNADDGVLSSDTNKLLEKFLVKYGEK